MRIMRMLWHPLFVVYLEVLTIAKLDHQLNEEIRDKEIRLIGEDGAQLGIMSAEEANNMAEEQGLDLVKISPNAVPPVCKIMDYSKFCFDQKKREKEAKKNQKVVEVKEIRVQVESTGEEAKDAVFAIDPPAATPLLHGGEKKKEEAEEAETIPARDEAEPVSVPEAAPARSAAEAAMAAARSVSKSGSPSSRPRRTSSGSTGCSRSMAAYFSRVSETLVRQKGLNLYVRQSHISQWFVKHICSIPILASASTISYMEALESCETSEWTW